MECHSIPAGEMPGATLLYTTFLNDFSRVSSFYSHPPNAIGIQQAAAEIRTEDAMRRGVVEVLRAQNISFGGDAATNGNLDRLRDGAVAVWRCHVPSSYGRGPFGKMWAFFGFTLSATTAVLLGGPSSSVDYEDVRRCLRLELGYSDHRKGRTTAVGPR